MKAAKTALVVALLLILGGCSSTYLPDHPGPVEKPAIVACLDSPLVSKANALAKSTPDKNYVHLLEIGDEALLARIHLIRSACKSIEIQTMIWANDETGRLVMYELIQAARRGVKVRLLIDHLASEQHIEIAHFLGYINPNFEIRLFNPVTGVFGQLKAEPSVLDKLNSVVFKFDRTNRRMHNKTFIIDNLIGITGGRNYQNAYYDRSHGLNFKDRDILALGPVVTEMRRSFDQYWNFKRSIRLTDLIDVKKQHQKGNYKNWYCRDCFALNGIFTELGKEANRPELISQLFVKPLLAVDHASFIADNPHHSNWSAIRDNGHSQVKEELSNLVSGAKQTVAIQTPYLVLSSQAIRMFRKLREENPEIDLRVSTNSLAATDSWYVYALSYKQKKTFLDGLGFKIYEFKPLPGDTLEFMPDYEKLKARAEAAYQERLREETFSSGIMYEASSDDVQDVAVVEKEVPFFCLHSKSLIVDDTISFVGSYNLDPRSENINTECGLVVKDGHFARILKGYIDIDMHPKNSWVIAPKKRLEGVDEANALLVELSHLLPLVDLWPFRYSASFELKDGREVVDISHPQFYKNYRDVGSFPQVKNKNPIKELGARGTKMFLGFVRPLL